MNDILNGVVDLTTGLLLRAGYCDFTQDGSYEPITELQVPDVPIPFFISNDPLNPDSEFITHWTGTDWDLVLRA